MAVIGPSWEWLQGELRMYYWFLFAGLLIFRAVAEPGISTKSAKSREIHQNTWNPARFARNLTKHMSTQYIWKLSWLLGLLTCCKRANLPRNNILKLPGVLRLITGKQRCKNPGVPSEDRGNWGWEFEGLFCRVFALREECRVLWRITPYTCTFISPTKMAIFFGTVRSTNDNAWKPAKWAKFMLVLTR